MMLNAFNLSIQEGETGGSEIQSKAHIQSKFEPNLDYLSPIFKNTEHYSSSGGTHPRTQEAKPEKQKLCLIKPTKETKTQPKCFKRTNKQTNLLFWTSPCLHKFSTTNEMAPGTANFTATRDCYP